MADNTTKHVDEPSKDPVANSVGGRSDLLGRVVRHDVTPRERGHPVWSRQTYRAGFVAERSYVTISGRSCGPSALLALHAFSKYFLVYAPYAGTAADWNGAPMNRHRSGVLVHIHSERVIVRSGVGVAIKYFRAAVTT